jgi:alcohol dehydrogenase
MQLGACLAGLAIENSMLGAAHALANPLTARYGIAHGEAIALMLPHVIRHNGRATEHWYRELVDCGPVLRHQSDSATLALANFVAEVSHQAGLRPQLGECDIARHELPKLASDATSQWTGKFNPVELTLKDFLSLYEAAF